MRFIRTPYNLLLVSALLMVLAAFVFSNRGIDIHLHDTYYITTFDFVFGLFAAFLFLLWAIYFISKKILLHPSLTWIHSVITILCIFILAAGFLFTQNKYFDYTTDRKFYHLETYWKYSLLLLIFIQVVFLINVFGGLGKKLFAGRKK